MLSFFFPLLQNQFVGEVLSSRIEESQKKSGSPLSKKHASIVICIVYLLVEAMGLCIGLRFRFTQTEPGFG